MTGYKETGRTDLIQEQDASTLIIKVIKVKSSANAGEGWRSKLTTFLVGLPTLAM